MAVAQRIEQITSHLQPSPAIGNQSLARQVAIVTGGARGEQYIVLFKLIQTKLTDILLQELVKPPLHCLQQMELVL